MDRQWVTASEAFDALVNHYGRSNRFDDYETCIGATEDTLLNRLKWGQLRARSSKTIIKVFSIRYEDSSNDVIDNDLVPKIFWETLCGCKPINRECDWICGDFSYNRSDNAGNTYEGATFAIELEAVMLPGFSLGNWPVTSTLDQVDRHTGISNAAKGRPQKCDWDGVMAHLVAIANQPDGLDALAVGTLLQADIEKAMAVWFTAQTGDAPVISQIRPKASAIIKAIAEVEKSRGHF